MHSIFCGECEYLVDIDKSQQGGYCDLYGGFHKFTAICNHQEDEDSTDERLEEL